jgi:hypothetical protein
MTAGDLRLALEYHRRAAELSTRASVAADSTSRSTFLLLAAYWEDKAKQAENGWVPAAAASALR